MIHPVLLPMTRDQLNAFMSIVVMMNSNSSIFNSFKNLHAKEKDDNFLNENEDCSNMMPLFSPTEFKIRSCLIGQKQQEIVVGSSIASLRRKTIFW